MVFSSLFECFKHTNKDNKEKESIKVYPLEVKASAKVVPLQEEKKEEKQKQKEGRKTSLELEYTSTLTFTNTSSNYIITELEELVIPPFIKTDIVPFSPVLSAITSQSPFLTPLSLNFSNIPSPLGKYSFINRRSSI